MKRRGARRVRSEEVPGPVQALEASAPYSARLSARSALYADLHVLLDVTGERLSSAAYRSLVVDDNCVARKSVAARGKTLATRCSPCFWTSGAAAAPSPNAV